MPRVQPQLSRLGLAGRRPLVRCLDAVVHGVSQQVVQRRFELFEDVAIHGRRRPDDFELDLFAELPAQVAHESREALHSIRERSHTAVDHFVVQTAIEIGGLPRMRFEFIHPRGQLLAALGQPSPRVSDRRRRAGARRGVRHRIQAARQVVVHFLELQ